jgi:hypothetical protein
MAPSLRGEFKRRSHKTFDMHERHKRLHLTAAAMLAATLLGTISQALASSADVLSAEVALNNAVLAHDTTTAGNYLTADYTLTTGSGKVLDKATLLAIVGDRKNTLRTNRSHDERVRMYGAATAIITGVVEEAGTNDGNPFDIQLPFTDTWVFQNGKWMQAAGHASMPLKT